MLRRIPVLPTLVVLVAVAIMVRLGFWQLDRLAQKKALIAQYQVSRTLPLSYLPENPGRDAWLYRKVWIFCRQPSDWRETAGRNASGTSGWAHVFTCSPSARSDDGRPGPAMIPLTVVAGWSQGLEPAEWYGGSIEGVVAPGAGDDIRVVAEPPLGGLEANAKPDPRDIPNNHFAYAIQWFLFALTALVIYALALRKRLSQGI
jgi:surfeit locus 1 family protein